MTRVYYEISDGSITTSYTAALEKKEQGYTYETIFTWEDLPVDKVDEGISMQDTERLRALRPLPKAGTRYIPKPY